MVARIPRTATKEELEPVADELAMLSTELLSLLETHINSQNISAMSLKLSATYIIQNQTLQLILNLPPKKAGAKIWAR